MVYYIFFFVLFLYIFTYKDNRIISYGIMIIIGSFGVGKTFNIMKIIRGSNATLTIGNFKSSYFDIEYRSIKDLVFILKQIKELKKKKLLKGGIDLVIDEGSIYFFSRFFQKFPSELIPFLMQLRKLDISLFILAQNLEQLDNSFIRLSNIIRYYNKGRILDNYIDLDPAEALSGLSYIDNIKEKEPYRIVNILGPLLYKILNFGMVDYDTKELIENVDIVDPTFDLEIFLKEKNERYLLKKQKSLLYRMRKILRIV